MHFLSPIVSAAQDTVVVILPAAQTTQRIEGSVIIAALAIIVGAGMQIWTLGSGSNNTRLALENARTQARASITSEHLERLIDRLTGDLSEYLTNSSFIDRGYQSHLAHGTPFPDNNDQKYLDKADLLYSKVKLQLNPSSKEDKELVTQLEHLRELGTDEVWIDRRDGVMEAAQAALAVKWNRIMQIELADPT